ncbi:DUF885 family protein [Paractinoplanes atraurantiacus]|uniref:DUF885 family protein n=1 Tax=Paractinoplanes atraurantiacus TaxID=1036182 RepID=UPI000BE3A713
MSQGQRSSPVRTAAQRLRADRLNRWQRLLCFCSGHAEGWAMYAERLMAELGYLGALGTLLVLDGTPREPPAGVRRRCLRAFRGRGRLTRRPRISARPLA